MAKRKKSRSFTDLSFTRQDLARNSHKTVAKIGYHLLLRVKPTTAINSVWKLKMLAKGNTIKNIATELSINPKTVSTFRSRILKKLDMKNNSELIHYAIDYSIED